MLNHPARDVPTRKADLNQLPKTRHSLVARLADTDNGKAWNEFLEIYEQVIYRYACSRGLQAADAENVTQQVLEAVMLKSRTWDASAGGSFGAWLFRVTRNLAAKTWNEREKGAVPLSDGGGSWLADEPSPLAEEQSIFQFEYRKALFHWAAMRVRDRFAPQTWDAFWQGMVQLRAPDQIAEDLGLSRSSVYVAKCRVLRRIRSEIERFEHEFAQHLEVD